jgi:hypothetical protein
LEGQGAREGDGDEVEEASDIDDGDFAEDQEQYGDMVYRLLVQFEPNFPYECDLDADPI